MKVHHSEVRIDISPKQLSDVRPDAQALLKKTIHDKAELVTPVQSEITLTNLQQHINNFSEGIHLDSVANLRWYLKNLPIGVTVGGIPTGKLLHYRDDVKIKPKSTIGAIGEGIVGFILEDKFGSVAIRPYQAAPDFVLFNREKVHLGEVKTTFIDKIPDKHDFMFPNLSRPFMTHIGLYYPISELKGKAFKYELGWHTVTIYNLTMCDVNSLIIEVE